jgi:hypothetical protein
MVNSREPQTPALELSADWTAVRLQNSRYDQLLMIPVLIRRLADDQWVLPTATRLILVLGAWQKIVCGRSG